ncbi:MAG TPA: hypothetical protein VIT23_09035, partial [Terrimicrobiaceae bacterium]
LLAACLFVQWCLLESLHHGRLAAVPIYDDVTYFAAGAQVLQSLRDGHVLQTFAGHMHSPFAVLLAAASFAIWGAKDWAPYAGNGIVILCYLGTLAFFFRRLPIGLQMGLLILFLGLPFATMAVVEFRPDMMWATLVGFATVYQITARGAFSSRTEALALGLLYGAAMMTKPSTFLMTTAAIGLGGLLRLLREALCGKLKMSQFFAWFTLFLLAALLVAGAYYFFHFGKIWRYFYLNSFGKNKDVWILSQSLVENLSYYIGAQDAPASNLGKWRLPILLFVGSSLLLGIVRPDNKEQRLIYLSLAIAMIGTWLASSLFEMKSPFLGGAFYGVLICGTAFFLRNVLTRFQTLFTRPITQSFTFVILTLFCLMMYTWPAYSEWDDATARYYRTANDGVWREIRKTLRSCSPVDGVVDIYCTNSSPIPQALLSLRAIQKRTSLRVHSGTLLEVMESHRALFDSCDVLIVQDPSLPGVNPSLPGEKLQMRITEEVLSRPDFELVKAIALGNKQIYVLQNRELLLATQQTANARPVEK